LALNELPSVSQNDVTGIPNEDTEEYLDIPKEELEQVAREGSTLDTLLALESMAEAEGGGFIGMLQTLLRALGFDVDVTGEMNDQTTEALEQGKTLLGNRDGLIEELNANENDAIAAVPNGNGLGIMVGDGVILFDQNEILEHGGSLKELLEANPDAVIAIGDAEGQEAKAALLEVAGIDPAAPEFVAPETPGDGDDPEVVTSDADATGINPLALAAGGVVVIGAALYRRRRNNNSESNIEHNDAVKVGETVDSVNVAAPESIEYGGDVQSPLDAEKVRAQSLLDDANAREVMDGNTPEAGRNNALREADIHMAEAHLHAADLPNVERAAYLTKARGELDQIVIQEMTKAGQSSSVAVQQEAFDNALATNADFTELRDNARMNANATLEALDSNPSLDVEPAENFSGTASSEATIDNAPIMDNAPDAPQLNADAPDSIGIQSDVGVPDANYTPQQPAYLAAVDGLDADSVPRVDSVVAPNPDGKGADSAAVDGEVAPDADSSQQGGADAEGTKPDAAQADGENQQKRFKLNKFGKLVVGSAAAFFLWSTFVDAEELPDDVRALAENGNYEEAAARLVEYGDLPYADELENLMESNPELVTDLVSANIARAYGDEGAVATFLGNLGFGEEVVQDYMDGNYGSVAAEISGFAEAKRNYEAAETTGDKARVVVGETAETVFLFTPAGLAIEGVSMARAGVLTFAAAKGVDLPTMEDAHREGVWDYFTTSDAERVFEAFVEDTHGFINSDNIPENIPQNVADMMELHAQWVLAEQALQTAKDNKPAWYANDRALGMFAIQDARAGAMAAKELYENHVATLAETGELMTIRSYMDAVENRHEAPSAKPVGPSPVEIGPEFMAQAADPENPAVEVGYKLVANGESLVDAGLSPIDIEATTLSIGDAVAAFDRDVLENPDGVSAAIKDLAASLPEVEREKLLKDAMGYYEEQPVFGSNTELGQVMNALYSIIKGVLDTMNDDPAPEAVANVHAQLEGYKAGV